ncbi:MAG: hypothetical protein K2H35_02095, partial [Muribaculaceae bacterium]|nr:hypothetical protein [Muribaculaceae bacterium]
MRNLLATLLILTTAILSAAAGDSGSAANPASPADDISAGNDRLPATRLPQPLRHPGTAEKIGYREGDTLVVIPANIRMIPNYCFT